VDKTFGDSALGQCVSSVSIRRVHAAPHEQATKLPLRFEMSDANPGPERTSDCAEVVTRVSHQEALTKTEEAFISLCTGTLYIAV